MASDVPSLGVLVAGGHGSSTARRNFAAGNGGDEITLLNAVGLKVHRVAYTADQGGDCPEFG